MSDYIPTSDADFNTWLGNFLSALDARKTVLGIPDAELAALQTTRAAWDSALLNHYEARAAAATATQAKNELRQNLERSLRSFVARTQAHPAIQDADRIALGITMRASTHTSAPAPTTRPVARIDTRQRLRHTLSFRDEASPRRRAKPAGVRGCEIWVKVGDAATPGPSELTFLNVVTTTPYVVEFDIADAGKVAHYMLRWVNSRGQKGPWSVTVSATITG